MIISCICSVDGRERGFSLAERWSDDNVFANRAYFMPEKQPAELGVDHIRESDQAVYRCRVDFNVAQTRNSKVNLTVIGEFPFALSKHQTSCILAKLQRRTCKLDCRNFQKKSRRNNKACHFII